MSTALIRSAAAFCLVLGSVVAGVAFCQERPAKVASVRPLPAPRGLRLVDVSGADKRLAGYRAPEGFEVAIVAEGPVVGRGVALTFADDGTPYLLETGFTAGDLPRTVRTTVKYRDGTTRQVVTRTKKTRDLVKALSSSRKDGPRDQARVVVEDEGASAMLLHDGWVYLAGGTSLRRYRPGKPGAAETIVRGLGVVGDGPAMTLHSGNDGQLILGVGAGDHVLEGSDGSRATVLRSGALFRCRPDGSRLHVLALGLREPRGAAFDLAGDLFVADGDGGATGRFAGGRLLHIVEGADYGWRLAPGTVAGRPDPVRAAARGERLGTLSSLLETGPGAPAGAAIYNDTRLPEEYRGLLLVSDAGQHRVRAVRLESAGATFRAIEGFDLLAARDEAFRPGALTVGPDGALYLLDSREGTQGRIYRLHWSGTATQPGLPTGSIDAGAKLATLKDDELLRGLTSDEATERDRARLEIVRRGERNRAALLMLLKDDDAPVFAKIAAVGAVQGMYNADVQDALLDALSDGDGEVQRLAAEALGLGAARGDRNVHAGLLRALASEDLAIRRTVAVAMGRLAAAGAGDNLATALSFYGGRDAYLRDGLIRGLELLGAPGVKSLIALADSGVQKDTDRVVEVFRTLRSREAFDALPALLRHPHVSQPQQADLIRSAANYQLEPPVTLDPLLAWLVGQEREPVALTRAMLEALAVPGTVGGTRAEEYVLGKLPAETEELRLPATAAAGQLRLVKAAPLLARRAGDPMGPIVERAASLRALRALAPKEALPLARTVLAKPGTAESLPLRREAFTTLAALEPEAGRAMARELLSGKEQTMQREAVRVLGATPEGARLVGRLQVAGKLPPALRADVQAALRRHAGSDAEAARLLAEVQR